MCLKFFIIFLATLGGGRELAKKDYKKLDKHLKGYDKRVRANREGVLGGFWGELFFEIFFVTFCFVKFSGVL